MKHRHRTHRLRARVRADLLHDSRGLSTVEYIILLVLIAVISIMAWKQFGLTVKGRILESGSQFTQHVVVPQH